MIKLITVAGIEFKGEKPWRFPIMRGVLSKKFIFHPIFKGYRIHFRSKAQVDWSIQKAKELKGKPGDYFYCKPDEKLDCPLT